MAISRKPPDNKLRLKHSIGLPMLCFFELGNTLIAGIYVLIGKVAGDATLL